MRLYSLLNTIATIMLLTYNLLHYKEKKKILGGVSRQAIDYFASRRWRILSTVGFWVVLEIIIVSAAQYYFTGYFNSLLGKLLETGANYFGNLFSAPILVLLVCILLKIDYLAQMDLVTPAFPLALFISKIACFFADCCKGVAWIDVFSTPIIIPVQLIESAAALLLFIFLMLCKGKMKKGTVFPIYLTTYSGLRFFTENFRCEPKVFLELRTYQILCLIGVALGVLEYFLVRSYDIRVQRKKLETENNHF